VRAAVGPPDPFEARCARLAAGPAEGAGVASVRQDRCGHRLEKTPPADAAVAAAPVPCPARTLADLVAVQSHREAELEHLGVCQARVGHVGLNDAGAVEAPDDTSSVVHRAACTGATGDRLVVLV